MAQPNTSWHVLLDRAVYGAGALLLVLETLPMLSGWANLDDHPRDQELLGLTLLTRASLIVLALLAALWGARLGLLVSAHLAAWPGLVAALLISWPDTARSLESEVMVPLWALQAVQLTWLAGARSRRSVANMVMVTGGAFLALDILDGIDQTGILNLVHATLTSLAVAAMVAYLRRGAAYADDVTLRTRGAREASAAEAAGRRAQGEARRLLHDEAITALRAIEHAAPADDLRPMCISALGELARRRVPTDRADLVATLVGQSPLPVHVASGGAWPPDVPGRVLEAFAAAAAEAIRNVHRHSGAGHAVLRTTTSNATLVVEVTDDGIGVAPGRTAGFGLTASIQTTMAQVHGHGALHSRPGGGTLVRLSWAPPSTPRPPHALNPLALENRARGYQLAVAPLAAGHLIASSFEATNSRSVSVGVGLLIGACVFAAARRFARRPARWADCVGLAVVVPALTALGLSNVGPGALMTLASWPIDFAALLIVVAAFEARLPRVVIPVAAQLTVVAWAASRDPLVGLADPSGAYFAAVVPVGFAWAIGRLIQRGSERVTERETSLAARAEEEAWQLSAEEARLTVRTDLEARVTPLLQRIATGERVDAAVIREAATLGARLRDLLYLDKPLPPALREAVDAARARGVTVGFRGADHTSLARLAPLAATALAMPDVEVATLFAGDDPRIILVPAVSGRGRVKLQAACPRGTTLTNSTAATTVRP